MTDQMTPSMSQLVTRAFEKLMQLRKDALRTKPAAKPISITGMPSSEATIKGASTTDAPTPRGS
jgi:hypothetical protein